MQNTQKEMKKVSINKFDSFVTEQYYAPTLANFFQRFYMLVRKPFPTTSDNVLGKMIGSTRDSLYDQLSLNGANYNSLPIQPGIPVLNFTEDNDLVQRMLDENIIDRKSLYNHPSQSKLVSDKVVFHKTFKESPYVPKTVFTVDETSQISFPVIAKPAQGRSAEGIRKFDTIEELSDSEEKFDVFCEAIDIAKEYRCFCFKEGIIELNRRVKIEGSADFLKDAATKTDFYYKKVDYNQYAHHQKLVDILNHCRQKVQLDFFSVDFAETPDGELFVIEMNSRTGMGVDKMVELYTLIYKDFYKNEPGDATQEKLSRMVASWNKAYDKVKGSQINECTTLAGNVDGSMFLFKNRDRSYTPETTVIHENHKGTEIVYRSEERRVGKECRSRWSPYH